MLRERVSDDIYVFTSELYVQVTAGLVVTEAGAVLIDTLPFPEETTLIRRFAENRLNTTIRYVINTHFHADHTTGASLFPNATVISHALCREFLNTRGRDSLTRLQEQSPDMRDLTLVLPHVVFRDGGFNLHLGEKVFQLWETPGHSRDSIVCLVKDDRVLFAGDTLMSLPYFVDGSYDDFVASLQSLRNGNFENVIQGHGEVILRGEVEEKIESDLDYLKRLRDHVDAALASRTPERALQAITTERCGKSRILLNGAVEQLHRNNVNVLANQRRALVED